MLSTKKNNSSSKGGSVSRRAKKKRKRRGRVVWKPKVVVMKMVVWEEGGDRLSRGRRSKAQRRIKAMKVMMMIGPQQVEEENRGKKMGFLA